jgi:DNA-directed RNA polymerase subunit RPC12/RpoP
MARETIGYTRLEWVCPNCGGKNPGPQKTCSTCGAPQPENVAFQTPARDELITDAAESQKAEAGPDIHCPYCGARNAAGSPTCTQCGGDLKGGAIRSAGQVLGALNQAPQKMVNCPSCASPNPDTATRCSNCGATLAPASQPAVQPISQPASQKKSSSLWMWAVGGLLLIALACGTFWLVSQATKRTDMNATVQSVAWERNIAIEKYGPVTKDNWKDQVPADAVLGVCEWRDHHTQDQPADNATKVCGTPYKVDKGNGFSAVVQDCEYQVKKEYCKYTINEWSKFNQVTASGSDLNPVWPDPKINDKNLRQGDKNETYTVLFDGNGRNYTYHPAAPDYYKYQIGSGWKLVLNGFDSIVSVSPQ